MGELRAIRFAISEAVRAHATGWTPSRWMADTFGMDSEHTLHHSFCVVVPESAVHQPEGRQRASEGLRSVDSQVLVRWAHRLRGDAQVGDYDEALDAEQTICVGIKRLVQYHILFESFSRRAGPEGYLLGEIRVRAVHQYALT